MYRNKFFKSFLGILGSAALVSTVSISTVACGKVVHKGPTVNSWDDFKKAALSETAPNLKSTIITPSEYHWAKNDVAIFNTRNGLPAISSTDAHTIVAIIVIKDRTSKLQYPINFKIKYSSDSKYDLNNWTYSQTPGLNKWSVFKEKATSISAESLLLQVKNSKVWSTLKWPDNPINNTWKDEYVPEFDVYGAPGMNGNPTADNTNFSVTATISIKDPAKRGLFDANPIKAVINDRDNSDYSVNDWKFSADTQSQSIIKYRELVTTQIDLAKKVIDPGSNVAQPKWLTFANLNWFYSNTLGYRKISDFLSNDQHPFYYGLSCITNETKTDIPITGGISSVISLTFYADGPDDKTNNRRIKHYAFTLTNNFLFKTTDKNSGPAFSALWTVSEPKPIK